MTRFIFIFLLLNASTLRAKPLIPEVGFSRINTHGAPFIFPNEIEPEQFLKSLRGLEIQPGVLLSTGFERAFINAAMLPSVTGVVILDINSHAVDAAQINTQLLRYANGRQDDYNRIRAHQDRAGSIDFLNQLQGFDQWDLAAFLETSRSLSQHSFSAGGEISMEANYWLNSDLYQKISRLAQDNRIVAHQADFFDFDGRLKTIIEAISASGEKISLIDVSNIFEWVISAQGSKKAAETIKTLFEKLSPVMNESAQVIYTREPPNPQDTSSNHMYAGLWEYKAISVKALSALTGEQLVGEFLQADKEAELRHKWQMNSYFKSSCPGLFSQTH